MGEQCRVPRGSRPAPVTRVRCPAVCCRDSSGISATSTPALLRRRSALDRLATRFRGGRGIDACLDLRGSGAGRAKYDNRRSPPDDHRSDEPMPRQRARRSSSACETRRRSRSRAHGRRAASPGASQLKVTRATYCEVLERTWATSTSWMSRSQRALRLARRVRRFPLSTRRSHRPLAMSSVDSKTSENSVM